MNDDQLDNGVETTVLLVAEKIEKKIEEKEKKRFRILYIVFGLASFLGIGVITQLVDFYANNAVEDKLKEARQELESAKLFSQLLALATKLDLSDSFTNTDRDTVVKLLDQAKDNSALRSEPIFVSLLEKILDSLSQSNSATQVTQIFDMYRDECLLSSGISVTMLEHYARRYLGATNTGTKMSKKDLERFYLSADAVASNNLEGIAAGLRSLVEFKSLRGKPADELKTALSSYREFTRKKISEFRAVLAQYSSPFELGKVSTPENVRISNLTQDFIRSFSPELREMGLEPEKYIAN